MNAHIQSTTRTALADLNPIPDENDWFANIDNPNTRRAYQRDVGEFIEFIGAQSISQLRSITRSHVLAWRDFLAESGLAPATRRRKLAALSSLFGYLTDRHCVSTNPVAGIRRPSEPSRETCAISDREAAQLLDAPDEFELSGIRDRAILSVLLHHGLRRAELTGLRVRDFTYRSGILHLCVHGKSSKLRYIPCHPHSVRAVQEYLADNGHAGDREGPLFRPLKNNRSSEGTGAALTPESVAKIVRKYCQLAEVKTDDVTAHSLRATAATSALSAGCDIAIVQEWLGHADISTTRIYDQRAFRADQSPTYQLNYK